MSDRLTAPNNPTPDTHASAQGQASRKGKRSRDKGATYERDVANILKAIYPEARRGIGQARHGGEVPDVQGAGPFWIEVKKGARTFPRAAISQAEAAMSSAHKAGRRDHWIPVAICRDDRDVATVTMFLDDWLALIGEWAADEPATLETPAPRPTRRKAKP